MTTRWLGRDQERAQDLTHRAPLPSVVIERRHAALHAAIDDALHATERAVRRCVHRRRMKPLLGRTGPISPW
jgi:ribosome-associated translation inhibitor RaiA